MKVPDRIQEKMGWMLILNDSDSTVAILYIVFLYLKRLSNTSKACMSPMMSVSNGSSPFSMAAYPSDNRSANAAP